jgi:hypothetical protein
METSNVAPRLRYTKLSDKKNVLEREDNIWHRDREKYKQWRIRGFHSGDYLTLIPRSRIFLLWRWRRHVPPKRQFTQDLHGATSQKSAFFISYGVQWFISSPIVIMIKWSKLRWTGQVANKGRNKNSINKYTGNSTEDSLYSLDFISCTRGKN